MSKIIKCSGMFPTVLIDLIDKRVEQEKLNSPSEYIRNTLNREILSPEMYLMYRRETNPSFDPPKRGPDNELYCLLSIDQYMENTDLSTTEKFNFNLPEDIMSWVDKEAKDRDINKTKLITILVMKEIADYRAYCNYRSIFDKKWLYKYYREILHCIHDDDPDKNPLTIPDEDMSWDPTSPSYDPNYHERENNF